MVFWTIWKKFYTTHLTFLGWLNYKLCQKMPKLEKNPCWWAPVVIVGSSSFFFASHPKNLKKFEKFGFFNFSDLFWMFTNGFRLWTIFFVQKNTFFRQNRKKVKIWWFFGNSENQLYPVTFDNDFFFFLAKLNVLWELYHQGCLTPQLWKSVSRTCCSLASRPLK